MRRGLIMGVALCLVALVLGGASPAPAAPGRPRSAVSGLDARFLSVRPPVGPTWVVDLSASSPAERLMLRTLEGLVNRSSARLYLKDPGDGGALRWLDEYRSRGLITVAGTTDVGGALDRFASEAKGYVLASEAEPWTIDVAATMASVSGAVVATPELVPELAARGLTQLDDIRGRWPDAATAYRWVVASYRARMPFQGIAVLRADDPLFDFTVQQGILTIFSRPSSPDWPQIAPLITATPAGHAVYGYLSDTGDEEAIAVATLSQAGLFLVPTDTTRNLSFQVAVGADRPRAHMAPPATGDVAPCTSATVNVVVGISDGDNLNVPLSRYSLGSSWQSPRRGALPLGWSIGPSLAVLAPSAWDTYVAEATPDDELVGMIGYGYAAPALLPDPAGFYRDSFALMDELGMRTFWSLGGGLENPSAGGWATLDAAAGSGPPTGVLVGYGNSSGVGATYASPAGRPAFTSGTSYDDTPVQLAAEVRALLARAPADRPLVSFLSASTWGNPVDQLVDALSPLEASGVRFLTPSEAAGCVPSTPVVKPPPATPGQCLAGDPQVPSGLSLISDSIAGEIKRVPTAVPVPVALTADPAVAAGGVIHYRLSATVDLQPLAVEILVDRARPLITAGYGAALAATASVQLAFTHLVLRVPLAPGTTAVGTPVATSTGGPAAARWAGGPDGPALEVELPPVSVDSRTPSDAVQVTASFTAAAEARPAPWVAAVAGGGASFDLKVGIGLLLGTIPLSGAVQAPWTCTPDPAVLATTAIGAAGDSPASTTTTVAPTGPLAPVAPTVPVVIDPGSSPTTGPPVDAGVTTPPSSPVPPGTTTTAMADFPSTTTTAPPVVAGPFPAIEGGGGAPAAVPVATAATFTG